MSAFDDDKYEDDIDDAEEVDDEDEEELDDEEEGRGNSKANPFANRPSPFTSSPPGIGGNNPARMPAGGAGRPPGGGIPGSPGGSLPGARPSAAPGSSPFSANQPGSTLRPGGAPPSPGGGTKPGTAPLSPGGSKPGIGSSPPGSGKPGTGPLAGGAPPPRSPADSSAKKDDKSAGGGIGGLAGKLSFGGGDKKDDPKKDDKKGESGRLGGLGGIKPPFGGGDKKDDKPGGGLAGRLPGFGGKKDEPKKADKPSGGGLAGKLPGFGGKKDDKPAASAPGMPKPGSSPIGGSPSAPGGASPFTNRPGGPAGTGDKPATPKGAAKASAGGGLFGSIKGIFGGKKEAKQAKPRVSKAPKVQQDGMSLDTKLDILGVGLVLGSLVVIFSSLSTQHGALTGGVNAFLSQNLGWGALGIPVAMFCAGVWLILRHFGEDAPTLEVSRLVGIAMLYIGLLTLLQYVETFTNPVYSYASFDQLPLFFEEQSIKLGHGGGRIGAAIYYNLVGNITEIGGFFALIGWLIVAMMLMLKLSAAEIALIVVSVFRSFGDAQKRRAQRRAVMMAEKQAALEAKQAAAAQLTVGKPAPEALPASPPVAAPAASVPAPPPPVAVPAQEERTIPIMQGGRTVTATIRPGESVTVAPDDKDRTAVPLAAALAASSAAPSSTTETQAVEKPEDKDKDKAATGGGLSRFMPRFGGKPGETPPSVKPAAAEKPVEKPGKATTEMPAAEKDDKKDKPAPAGGALGRLMPRIGGKPDDKDKAAAKADEKDKAPSAPSVIGTVAGAAAGALTGKPDKPDDKRAATQEKPAVPTLAASAKPSLFEEPVDFDDEDEDEDEDDSAVARLGDLVRPASAPPNRPITPAPSPFARPGTPLSAPSPRGTSEVRRPDAIEGLGDSGEPRRTPVAPFNAPKPGESRPAAFRAPVPPVPAPASKPDVQPVDADEDADVDASEIDEDITKAWSKLPPAQPKGTGALPGARPTAFSAINRPGMPPRPDTAVPKPGGDRPAYTSLQERMEALRSGKVAGTEDKEPEAPAAPLVAQTMPKIENGDEGVEDKVDATAASDAAKVEAKPDTAKIDTPIPATAKPSPPPEPISERRRPNPVIVPFEEAKETPAVPAAEAPKTAAPTPTPPTPPQRLGTPAAFTPPPLPPTPPQRPASFSAPPPAPPLITTPSSGHGTDAPVPLPTFQRMRREWKLPDHTTLLTVGSDQELNHELLIERARIIEDTLLSFGAPGRVVEVRTGPVVTQFGVEPDYLSTRGGKKVRVKVGAIAQLDKDLQLALGAKSIRIEAPVPGKGYVGIEVPNETATIVRLRDVMESPEFKKLANRPLAICLGQSVDGTPVSADLAAMPHLLIAGTTGSGKSVCVNATIASLLLRNTPDRLKFIMVDPKRVELTQYNGIPHLAAPVVVELERIVTVLKWVTREMDERYKRFSSAGARNIEDFNKHLPSGEVIMPYIIVIIDELADLMMLAPDETERVITRIAALARATGIHLVIATQRPSVDVVTGLIKANFPARIAFAVAGGVDSRVILDQPGAERLLGRGDMLYMSGDSPAPQRLQGVYVSDSEIGNITRYWRGQTDPDDPSARPMLSSFAIDEAGSREVGSGASTTSWQTSSAGRSGSPTPAPRPAQPQQAFWDRDNEGDDDEGDDDELDDSGEDALYEEAVELVRRLNKASVSLLQRRLRIGYTRAARLIDLMEERGVVGPAESGAKPREVLRTR